jgi:multidrug transporter EmrE-like cation transporter
MRIITIGLLVTGFIASSVASSLIFRVAAQHTGKTALLYFILGNTAGIAVPVCLTFALRGTNPNVIYALTIGGAFCALQLASWIVFREVLSPVQWTGVALVALGLFLLPFN